MNPSEHPCFLASVEEVAPEGGSRFVSSCSCHCGLYCRVDIRPTLNEAKALPGVGRGGGNVMAPGRTLPGFLHRVAGGPRAGSSHRRTPRLPFGQRARGGSARNALAPPLLLNGPPLLPLGVDRTGVPCVSSSIVSGEKSPWVDWVWTRRLGRKTSLSLEGGIALSSVPWYLLGAKHGAGQREDGTPHCLLDAPWGFHGGHFRSQRKYTLLCLPLCSSPL